MRCSCQGLHGCVPVAPRVTPSEPASSASWARRSPRRVEASSKSSQRPVRISTSEAISSPTRCSSSGVPAAAAWSSSNRFVSESVAGSRIANSSSTASVRSVASSYCSRAVRICSSGVSRWASPTGRYIRDSLVSRVGRFCFREGVLAAHGRARTASSVGAASRRLGRVAAGDRRRPPSSNGLPRPGGLRRRCGRARSPAGPAAPAT